MNRRLLLCCFILIFLGSQAQDSCVVKLNLTDCVTCYGGLSKVAGMKSCQAMNDLSGFSAIARYKHDSIPVDIVVRKSDRKSASRFIGSQLGLKFNYHLTASDSLYNVLSSAPQSEVIFYERGRIVYKAILKAFDGSITARLVPLREILIRDTLLNPGNSNFYYKNDRLISNDYVFNRISAYDLHSGKLIRELDLSRINSEEFFNAEGVDSVSRSIYRQSSEAVKAYGLTRVQCSGLAVADDWLICNLAYRIPVFSDSLKQLNVQYKTSLRFLKSDSDSSFSVSMSGFQENLYKTCNLIVTSGPYYLYDDNFCYLYKSRNNRDSLYIAKFSVCKGALVSKGTATCQLPSFYRQAGTVEHVAVTGKISYPYFSSTGSPEIINLNTLSFFSVPAETDKISSTEALMKLSGSKFLILDMQLRDDVLKILHVNTAENEKRYFVSTYSASSGKLKSFAKIVVSESHPIKLILFSGQGNILGIDDDNRLVEFAVPELTL